MATKRKRDNDNAEPSRPPPTFDFECRNLFLSNQDGVDALRRLFDPNGPLRIRTHNLVISSQHHIDKLVEAGATQTSFHIAIKQEEPAVDIELADAPDVAASFGANINTNGNVGGARDEEGVNGDGAFSSVGYNGNGIVTPLLNGVQHAPITIDEGQADPDANSDVVIVGNRTVQNGGLDKTTEQLATAHRCRAMDGTDYTLDMELAFMDVVAKIDVTSFFGYGKNRVQLEGTTARNFNNTGLVLLCIHCGAPFSSVSTISKLRKAEHSGCEDKPLKQCYSKRCAFELPRDYVDSEQRYRWDQSECLRSYIAELQGGKNDK